MLAVPSNDIPFLISVLAGLSLKTPVADMEPLRPCMKPLRVLRLMIPPEPSASYFAEGLDMSSTFSMVIPGFPFRKTSRSLPERLEGRPSIHTATVCPFSCTFPSLSTVTPGEFFRTSRALPVFAAASSETLSTILSKWCSMSSLFPDTTADARACESSSRMIVFSISVSFLTSTMFSERLEVNSL